MGWRIVALGNILPQIPRFEDAESQTCEYSQVFFKDGRSFMLTSYFLALGTS